MLVITNDMVPNYELAKETVKDCMKRGIKVDVQRTRELIQDRSEDLQEYLDEIQGIHGLDNPNSNPQVQKAFLRELDPDDLKYCKNSKSKGKLSFNSQVLAKLSELGYDLASLLIRYRKLKSSISTLSSLIELKDKEDLIHPEVSMSATNRFSYSKPALMSIPKEVLWDVIIPRDTDKYALYSVDISQQEPWILVHWLEIEELREMIKNHKDFYKALYHAAFGIECTDAQRAEVKTAWNAMSYGANEPTVCSYCTTFDGHVLYKYFNSIKEYKEYKNDAFRKSKQGVYKTESYFGTVMYAEEQGGKLQRLLMNQPIQGTGSDILAFLIEEFKRQTESNSVDEVMKIYYTRHDELIIEVDKSFADDNIIKTLTDIFTHTIDDWEPFRVEVKRVSK